MSSQTAPQGFDGDVTVYIRDVNSRETIPHRVVYLQPPNFEKRIGRGSQAEQHLHPHPWNTWFGSRVMSREHAILRADPISKTLTIEDTRSMHGTYVGGSRLVPGQKFTLKYQDNIQFGAEIIRGDQTYKPLNVVLAVDFEDHRLPSRPTSGPPAAQMPKNTFRIDFSDDENDDDEIQVISESIRIRSHESENPSTFSVPDSETSDSYLDQADYEDSVTSSPIESPNGLLPKSNEVSGSQIPGSSAQHALRIDVDADADNDDKMREVNQENDENLLVEHDALSVHSCHTCSDVPTSDDSSYGGPDEWPEEEEPWDEHEEPAAINNITIKSQEPPAEPDTTSYRVDTDYTPPQAPWCPQKSIHGSLPTIHSLVDQAPVQPASTFSGQAFFPQSTATSRYQPMYYGNSNWLHSENNPNTFVPYDHGINFPSWSVMRLTHPTSSHDINMAIPAIPAKDDDPCKSSKISINAIIDDVQAGPATSINKNKRKADQVSTDNVAGEPVEIAANCDIVVHDVREMATRISNSPELQCTQNDTVELQPSDSNSVKFSSEPEIIEPDNDRPRKIVKRENRPESGKFFKYFATALAGATVGAVGTVFGLAALPADYFV